MPKDDWWTLEEEVRLIELVASERCTKDIAVKSGRSRNAVIGKIGRLRHAGRITETHWAWDDEKKLFIPRKPRVAKPKPKPAPQPKPKREPGNHTPDPWIHRALPKLPMRRVTLMELRPQRCHWPVGEPGEPGFCFCGNATDGRPYCAPHHAFAHHG